MQQTCRELAEVGVRADDVAELSARKEHSRARGGEGGVHQRRYLRDRVSGHDMEQERRALGGRNSPETVFELGSEPATVDQLVRARGPGDQDLGVDVVLQEPLQRKMPPALVRSEMVLGDMNRDATQPAAEACLAAIARQTVQGLDERRLDEVLDVGGTSNDPAYDAPDHRRVTPDLLGQRYRLRVRRRGRRYASDAALGRGRLHGAHVVSAAIRRRPCRELVRPTDEAVFLRHLLAGAADRSIAKRDDAAVAGALSDARVDGSWWRSVGALVAVGRASARDREQARQ